MTEVEKSFESITVVEPLPPLLITMPRTAPGTPTIRVEGMSTGTAADINWGKIIDLGIAIGKHLLQGGGGGGGGGATGCTTVTIKNADGSTVKIEQCPPPKDEGTA